MSETRNTGDGGTLDLKSLRESRGLTIEALYNATKVRPAFLEAIENGNFQILPERIYSEAFIKIYAAQVGVDPEGILARYRRYLNVPEPGKAPEKKTDKKTEKKADKKPEKQAESRKEEGKAPLPAEIKTAEPAKGPETPVVKSPMNMPKRRFSRLAVSLILSVVVICGGFLYFLLLDDGSSPELLMKAEKPAAPAQSESKPQAAPDMKDMQPGETPQQPAAGQSAPSAGQPAPAVQPAAPASNKLVIHANELTWISVTEDGSQPYQIMLRPGDNLERTAGKFLLDIGNAGGIVVNFNGSDMGVPGRSGQVVHLVLPPEQAPE
ncbi:MAG: RodZ domain-containing protein [Syntrophaceae bacterium]